MSSISGSPSVVVLTRAFLSLYHKAAKSCDIWTCWCNSGEKEVGYSDVVLEIYLQGTPKNPGPPRFQAGLAHRFFISAGEGDRCCVQEVVDFLTALTVLLFTHPTPKPAVTILLYRV